MRITLEMIEAGRHTMGNRLTSFSITADGELAEPRTFAQVEGLFPDGICLDAEGAIWVADPRGNQVVRVREGVLWQLCDADLVG